MGNPKFPVFFLSHGGGPWPWVDGMRQQFAATERAFARLPAGVERITVFNKVDLVSQWEVREDLLDVLRQKGWRVIKTSAKNGDDVDQAFIGLARAMVEG